MIVYHTSPERICLVHVASPRVCDFHNMLYLWAVFCLICLARGEYQHPRRSCQVENNLTMLPDRYDRSAYYVCLYGRAQKFFCPPGLKFDQHKPACVPNRYRLRRSSGFFYRDLHPSYGDRT